MSMTPEQVTALVDTMLRDEAERTLEARNPDTWYGADATDYWERRKTAAQRVLAQLSFTDTSDQAERMQHIIAAADRQLEAAAERQQLRDRAQRNLLEAQVADHQAGFTDDEVRLAATLAQLEEAEATVWVLECFDEAIAHTTRVRAVERVTRKLRHDYGRLAAAMPRTVYSARIPESLRGWILRRQRRGPLTGDVQLLVYLALRESEQHVAEFGVLPVDGRMYEVDNPLNGAPKLKQLAKARATSLANARRAYVAQVQRKGANPDQLATALDRWERERLRAQRYDAAMEEERQESRDAGYQHPNGDRRQDKAADQGYDGLPEQLRSLRTDAPKRCVACGGPVIDGTMEQRQGWCMYVRCDCEGRNPDGSLAGLKRISRHYPTRAALVAAACAYYRKQRRAQGERAAALA